MKYGTTTKPNLVLAACKTTPQSQLPCRYTVKEGNLCSTYNGTCKPFSLAVPGRSNRSRENSINHAMPTQPAHASHAVSSLDIVAPAPSWPRYPHIQAENQLLHAHGKDPCIHGGFKILKSFQSLACQIGISSVLRGHKLNSLCTQMTSQRMRPARSFHATATAAFLCPLPHCETRQYPSFTRRPCLPLCGLLKRLCCQRGCPFAS